MTGDFSSKLLEGDAGPEISIYVKNLNYLVLVQAMKLKKYVHLNIFIT